tara:strand:- start:1752 stop:1871 length:120 start_codon:yes stop_codon:yes gene_type:complete
MDINSDGGVDEAELEYFYKTYDLNENGILESAEIKAALN